MKHFTLSITIPSRRISHPDVRLYAVNAFHAVQRGHAWALKFYGLSQQEKKKINIFLK
jgi:hypothetical protein